STQGGKIDQAGVDVLDLGATLLDLVDATRDRAPLTFDLCRRLRERGRRDAAAVAGDAHAELLLALEGLNVGASVLHHLLDERTHLEERFVRFLGSEVAWHRRNPMI